MCMPTHRSRGAFYCIRRNRKYETRRHMPVEPLSIIGRFYIIKQVGAGKCETTITVRYLRNGGIINASAAPSDR